MEGPRKLAGGSIFSLNLYTYLFNGSGVNDSQCREQLAYILYREHSRRNKERSRHSAAAASAERCPNWPRGSARSTWVGVAVEDDAAMARTG